MLSRTCVSGRAVGILANHRTRNDEMGNEGNRCSKKWRDTESSHVIEGEKEKQG